MQVTRAAFGQLDPRVFLPEAITTFRKTLVTFSGIDPGLSDCFGALHREWQIRLEHVENGKYSLLLQCLSLDEPTRLIVFIDVPRTASDNQLCSLVLTVNSPCANLGILVPMDDPSPLRCLDIWMNGSSVPPFPAPGPNLASAIRSMRNERGCTDLVLRAGGNNIAVHRVVLAARSPVLRNMFEDGCTALSIEKLEPHQEPALELDVDRGDASAFDSLVDHMYDKPDALCNERVLLLAERFDCSVVRERCMANLERRLNPEIACEILLSVQGFPSMLSLANACRKFAAANPLRIFATDWYKAQGGDRCKWIAEQMAAWKKGEPGSAPPDKRKAVEDGDAPAERPKKKIKASAIE